MKITSKKQAVDLLESVRSALDQLTVKGKTNCYIVVACSADVEAVKNFLLHDSEDEPQETPSNLEEMEELV